MSGDVQPRKRKDKRKKKDEDDLIHHHGSIGGSDEIIHIHKESKLGGNFCSKIVFFGLLGVLGLMVGLIIIECQGTSDVDTQSAANSPWSVMLEGWVDDKVGHNDHGETEEHNAETEHSSHEDEDEGKHDDHVEGVLFEGGHGQEEEEEEEEVEEDIEDVSYVQQTYDDLKAAYSQLTPEESDVEHTEEENLKSTDYEATESETEVSEIDTQIEEEEDEEDRPEDDPRGQWKSVSGPDLLAEEVEDVQTESEAEEESEDEASNLPPSGGPKSSQIQESEENEVSFEHSDKLDVPHLENEDVVYQNADITNEADWEIREDLDEADRDLDEGNPSTALSKFSALVTTFPNSSRALYGKARALDLLAEAKRSNILLTQAISAYSTILQTMDLTDTLLLRLANRTIVRMRFKGMYLQAVEVHNKLIERFPTNISFHIDLAVTYLMMNRLEAAKLVLEAAHKKWPEDKLCEGYLGLTLKLQGAHKQAIPHLLKSVQSNDTETINSRFYLHLGDALQRNNQNDKAMEIYKKGVTYGLFRSEYQRSLYNVDRLKAQPWWTLEETTYETFFKKLEDNWNGIRNEGLAAYKERQGFLDEAESLRDVGDWKQFELYARGQKYQQNCKKTPVTCRLIEELSAARSCRRGQVKFSIMEGGTHVWPHCGPTNCRLRAHLGLVVPPGTAIRVANDTRKWKEGKVIVFDDSFEHEVWHNGSTRRLVLIVDVWHPELTASEIASLTSI